jgi:hypothetical protein
VTIATLADYHAALKLRAKLTKSAVLSANVNTAYMSLWQGAGEPGAGSGSGNTANGIVPTKATTGAIQFPDFSGTGYLSAVEFCADQTVTRLVLFDKLFSAGTYALNANVTLASQPSFSSRLPGGSYEGLQLWGEKTGTGNATTVTVTYTNSQGVTGHSTGATTVGAGTVARPCTQFPLAAGDTGIQKIESVVVGASGGTVDIWIVRPLWSGVIDRIPNEARRHFFDLTGLPIVYTDSCLAAALFCNGNTTLPVVDLELEIAAA